MARVLSDDKALVSRFDWECQGSHDPDRYFIAPTVSVGTVKTHRGRGGSSVLDEICAFDKAEVAEAHLGRLNLIQVSSFCGPDGIIWGYDVAQPKGLCDTPILKVPYEGHDTPIYDGEPLLQAAKALFGTIDRPNFTIRPGSHVPAAYKSVTARGPTNVFAALALGVPGNRLDHPVIVMEDIGTFAARGHEARAYHRAREIRAIAQAVVQVAEQQRQGCVRIFVLYRSAEVAKGEVGCALALAPYFSLAKKAVPASGLRSLESLSLEGWQEAVSEH